MFPAPHPPQLSTERLFAATEGIEKSWAWVTHELHPDTQVGLRETCLFLLYSFKSHDNFHRKSVIPNSEFCSAFMALLVGHRRADTSSTEGVLFYLAKKAYKACSCLDSVRLKMYSGQAKRDANILWATKTVTVLLHTPTWGYSTTHNKVFWHLPFGAWGTHIFYLTHSTPSVEKKKNWVSSGPHLLFCPYYSNSQILS